jgi:DnaK suppressor protein
VPYNGKPITPALQESGNHNGRVRYTETGEPLRKTRLSPADLDEFRQLLTAKRNELIGDMNHLRKEALGHGSSGEGGSSSSMPIHMADLGSDTWEQELTLGFIEKERGLLREIEDALDRIDDRTYGICLATNRPISKARLRATPCAKHCIEYARKRELGRG